MRPNFAPWSFFVFRLCFFHSPFFTFVFTTKLFPTADLYPSILALKIPPSLFSSNITTFSFASVYCKSVLHMIQFHLAKRYKQSMLDRKRKPRCCTTGVFYSPVACLYSSVPASDHEVRSAVITRPHPHKHRHTYSKENTAPCHYFPKHFH